MFSKKCMVVGSLLVMAAQTATAADCSTVAGAARAALCARPNYTGAKNTANNGAACANDPCSGADADLCCVPTALCTTISTPATFCGSDSEYVHPGQLIAAANTTRCQGDSAAEGDSGDPAGSQSGATCSVDGASTDEATCCIPRANCDTIIASTPAATFCAGDAYTGALKPNDAQNRCAGATCQRTDSFTGDADTCCVQLVKAKCSSISDVQTNCPAPGYTGLNGDKTNSECAGVTCGPGDASTCCTAAVTCTSDYKDDDDMVASGAGTASGASITFTCDSGYAATENGVATCQDDGTWSGGKCEKVTPTCSVTDGSKATPWTGGTAAMEECTCTGAAKKCSTLNVCDVAKKTCVCTPGKDHWCYESAERSFAVKFGCFKEGENKFKGWKCVGDNVLQAKYSDATCDTQITPANDGEDTTFSATKMTEVKKESGTLKTTVDTTTTGISTCKGGVPGAGAGAAAPGPAPGAAAPGPSGDAEFDAGSVAQCSTLAMLMVVAAMWAGRN